MASRKETLDELGKYAAQGSFETDPGELVKMLRNESDRGLVVVLGSHLEEALLERICRDLPAGEASRRALTKGGPLRNFEQRIVMARAMGIIDEQEAEIFHVFRHMRNACSHSKRDISFKTPELLEALALLFPPAADTVRGESPVVAPSAAFIICSAFLLNGLAGQSYKDSRLQLGQLIKGWVSRNKRAAAERRPSSPRKPNSKQARDLRPRPTGKGRRRQPPTSEA